MKAFSFPVETANSNQPDPSFRVGVLELHQSADALGTQICQIQQDASVFADLSLVEERLAKEAAELSCILQRLEGDVARLRAFYL